MPYCNKHQQQYNQDEYCVYCGKPFEMKTTTTNIEWQARKQAKEIPFDKDQPCQHEWECNGIGGFPGHPHIHCTGPSICKKCGKRE